jgi:hypothetical protein
MGPILHYLSSKSVIASDLIGWISSSQALLATAPGGAGQYRTEAEAKGHCPADTVVWINLKSKVYHFAGTKKTTKKSAYMCEKEAAAQGDRASKSEHHP